METRRLGRHGPEVSAVGLGCMGMSSSYGTPGEAESRATLERAHELGVTLFDTADIYGPYTNEQLLAPFVRAHRSSVVLATKCGFVPVAPDAPRRVDGSPRHIREACEASLRRLGVSTIDLYYLHRVDPETPIEESVRAMAGLVDAGKVRYLGLSEVNAATLRRAHAVHPITAVQSEYSLWTRGPEAGVLAACRELGVALVPFSPLGRGFLSGRVRSTEGLPADDFRRDLPRFAPGNLERNLALVDRLLPLAKAHGCTVAQLALAWVLAQGADVVPIPGAKQRSHLEENVGAVSLRLSPAELAAIDAAFPAGAAAGERYGASSMAWVQS